MVSLIFWFLKKRRELRQMLKDNIDIKQWRMKQGVRIRWKLYRQQKRMLQLELSRLFKMYTYRDIDNVDEIVSKVRKFIVTEYQKLSDINDKKK